ncbi:SspB family protein [Roseococcus sp. YIM B11640]|uniref:SspB family protein n=1 Tax=Roseococcus sp. YIM B11640 TaxID=3133973 RepID=UPI003C7A95AF
MSDKPPQSLLPYESWAARALRSVAVDALEYAAREGLPGDHHFYISFRTDHPGTTIPGHLKARYPQEMTIVLQHRFWDLQVDRAAQRFSVGLSFSGVSSILSIPFAALTAFQDPFAHFGLRFEPELEIDEQAASVPDDHAGLPEPEAEATPGQPQVVSLDAFRRKRE